MLVDSVSAIRQALDMKALGYSKWWASLASALVLSLFGALMVFNPFKAMSTLVLVIGLGLVYLMMAPFSEFLLGAEREMLQALQRILTGIAG